MGDPRATFRVDDETDLGEVVSALGEEFEIAQERTSRRATYYDTFDWRLWRRGERLVVEPAADGFVASWVGEGESRRLLRLASEPGMAVDLPAGEAGEALGAVIAMRRLLPVAEIRCEGLLVRVLDRRRKTVVRLRVEERRVRKPGSRARLQPLRPLIHLGPVKGYQAAARRMADWLESARDLSPHPDVELQEAAAALGREVGDYGPKATVALDPELEVDVAARLVLRSLLARALANEEGLLADVDTEFLHDFRVAVRRTRSALSQIKGIFEPDRLAPFRREFSWLGKVTGPTRDLDVYLLKLPGYAAGLPLEVRDDLEPLGEHLSKMHRLEQRKLVRQIRSARYRRLMKSWSAFLEEAPDDAARPERARQPVSSVARAVISKAHRKVLRKGAAISDETPPAALHRLRLDCKKLRYLMEFFRSLFPPKRIDRAIAALKDFQDNLGDFQDYGVQQQMLRRLAAEMGGQEPGGPLTLMAIGRLVAALENGEARERRRFHKSFARFSSKRTRRRFRKMLEGGDSR